MSPILSVRNLTRRYGSKAALSDVSFDLYPGEIVGLLGLNGAGKSTALSLLSGRLSADSGEIDFQNTPISQVTGHPNRIGFVPEGAPLFEDLTVSAHLSTLAGLYGVTRNEAKPAIDLCLERFELADVARTPINALSKGYRRRVALAGAFLTEPELLMLDEPTDGLDPVQKARMLELLKSTRDRHTLLVSTHSLEDVEALCDRVLILKDGHLVFDGALEALAELGGTDGVHGGFLRLVSGESQS